MHFPDEVLRGRVGGRGVDAGVFETCEACVHGRVWAGEAFEDYAAWC